MTTNAEITLYHYDDEACAYTVHHYPASLHKTVKSASAENGFQYADSYKIRVPTTDVLPISTGDYIRFGMFYDERPEKGACVKIAAFSDNRRGRNPHWRIDAV